MAMSADTVPDAYKIRCRLSIHPYRRPSPRILLSTNYSPNLPSAWRLYCTVTGLSWLGGNSSQISGGDRVSRLISILRPQSIEARAHKNFTRAC